MEHGQKNIIAEKAFYHQDNLFVPQTGKTCNFDEAAQPFITCENALRELAYQRFSSLNSQYHPDVLASWNKGECMPEIRRRLGCRFRLVESSVQVEGSEVRVSVTVHNDGSANLYNPRSVFLILRNRATGATQRVQVSSNPRRWMPSKSTTIRVVASVLRLASAISCCTCRTSLPRLAAGPNTLFASLIPAYGMAPGPISLAAASPRSRLRDLARTVTRFATSSFAT
jgi:hypothetical protein